jgi:phosphate transport system permease protein
MLYVNIENNMSENTSEQLNSMRSKSIELVRARLGKRKASERRFRWYGRIAILMGLSFLAILFVSITSNGYTAFQQTYVQLDVNIDPDVLDLGDSRDRESLSQANYGGLVKATLRSMFPEVTSRSDKRTLYSLASTGASYQLRNMIMEDPSLIGSTISVWVLADDEVDMFMKGYIDPELPESDRRLKDNQLTWIDKLLKEDRLEKRFNTTFFTAGDSRDPELAGIWGAASGSFFTLIVTLLLSFPIGVSAAVYLEEFAPQNRFTDFIEININNLAAVPSIVFGLLGLAVFINFFGLPRSAPLVGGLVLTLMTLPTIIIASRAALKSVPPSIREAALGIGASPMQAMLYHVVPLAMPGMLTGTIIGMAQALGESAPLLMIGMVAFIVDIPSGVFDPSTALPVQIYLWADSPERAFVERTSAAIMVLLGFLIAMNALAVLLRKRFERRW